MDKVKVVRWNGQEWEVYNGCLTEYIPDGQTKSEREDSASPPTYGESVPKECDKADEEQSSKGNTAPDKDSNWPHIGCTFDE